MQRGCSESGASGGAERNIPEMRSHDDEVAFGVLTLWAAIRIQMSDFRKYLRDKHAVLATAPEIASDIECAVRTTGPALSVWVEADVGNGEVLTWGIDISARDEGWLFEASLMWNGRDPILMLPDKNVKDFLAVQQMAPIAIEELFEAGKPIFEEAIEQVRRGQS
jgi:hypothetical protein